MCCDLVVSGIVLLINVTNAVIPSEVEGSRREVPFKLAQRDPSTFARDDDESSTPRYDSLWLRYLRRLS